ncbi:hypothetical protein [Nocardia sp. NPDC046763]|uniref:hypothetical protein n=1 Tax=Nocardia sp. NPDC046763 TaxID=3155256 RepID=UPI0033E4443A
MSAPVADAATLDASCAGGVHTPLVARCVRSLLASTTGEYAPGHREFTHAEIERADR